MSIHMTRRIDRNVLWVVAAGFALTILLLLGSGSLSIQAIQRVESRSAALREHHRISTLLIDEIQGEEAGLSGLFYAIVSGRSESERHDLLKKLSEIEADVNRTLQPVRPRSNTAQWTRAQQAVERYIGDVRNVLEDEVHHPAVPSELYRSYQSMVVEVSSLVSANYRAAIEHEAELARGNRNLLEQALALLAVALLLSIGCAATTVRIAAKVFRRTNWQAKELSRLSRRVMEAHEQSLHQFSRELHDEFGQSLTAIEANLAALPVNSPEVGARVEDCLLLVKDAISKVRELAQLLRPSMLDDFGLAPSLQLLADSFSQRTGVTVKTEVKFDGRLPGETETHLFRIVQEALTNVTRHSSADTVTLQLEPEGGMIRLTIADNGHGAKPGRTGGLGLTGMRERMRMVGGNLETESGTGGFVVRAEVPLGAE